MIWPLAVSPLSPSSLLASPKSVTRGWPVGVEQDVGRLEVAVDDAVLVGVLRRPRRPADQLRPPRAGAAGRRRPLRQALALDEPHAEVMLPVVLADLVDRHDAGMVEVGGGLGLGVEPLDVGVVGELAGEDHLEGHGAVQADLPRLVDDPHAAAGDLAEQLVVAEAPGMPGRGGSGRPLPVECPPRRPTGCRRCRASRLPTPIPKLPVAGELLAELSLSRVTSPFSRRGPVPPPVDSPWVGSCWIE